MENFLKKELGGKKVLILGFGREGRSTFETLQKLQIPVAVADTNEGLPEQYEALGHIPFHLGPGYLDVLNGYDIVIKTPGISLKNVPVNETVVITSQTDLFLRRFHAQIVGVTGTKGKSTTASLIYHLLKEAGMETLIAGNIGIPLFNILSEIRPETRIVCELSSHQLEYIRRAPHISLLLNIFQEHLDHYRSYTDYQNAKLNIALKQETGDVMIFNPADPVSGGRLAAMHHPSQKLGLHEPGQIWESGDAILLRLNGKTTRLLPVDFQSTLLGKHNRNNSIMAVAAAVIAGMPPEKAAEHLLTFQPLDFRMEKIVQPDGTTFYNDSISTIPESAIAALESLPETDVLILGGYDRGIEYSHLAEYLAKHFSGRIFLNGPAGERIFQLLQPQHLNPERFQYIPKFDDCVRAAIDATPVGGVCLLSPAATSYDAFGNFEERGRRYKQLIAEA